MKKSLNYQKIFKNSGMATLLLVWVGAACIASQYIISYPMLWILGHVKFTLPVWTTVRSALIYVLSLTLIIFVPKLIKKTWATSFEKLGLKKFLTFTDIGIGIISFIATIIISSIVLPILQSMNLIDASQAQVTGYENLYNPADRIVGFIALVIIAPIAEELIFRGWLYGKLRAKIPAFPAIVLVSLLFALVHGQWNVGVIVFAMSVINCLIRELTGTVYGGILVHIIRNSIAFYGLFILHMV
jgi:membrane protease YdiL (CAAX protease family)